MYCICFQVSSINLSPPFHFPSCLLKHGRNKRESWKIGKTWHYEKFLRNGNRGCEVEGLKRHLFKSKREALESPSEPKDFSPKRRVTILLLQPPRLRRVKRRRKCAKTASPVCRFPCTRTWRFRPEKNSVRKRNKEGFSTRWTNPVALPSTMTANLCLRERRNEDFLKLKKMLDHLVTINSSRSLSSHGNLSLNISFYLYA